jgi:hypothetical protein
MIGARRRCLVRAEDLIGQRVAEESGREVGRIEDIRVEQRGDSFEVTEYLLGTGALLERLGITRWFGREAITLVARWDQLDVHDAERPTLTCPKEELRHERH